VRQKALPAAKQPEKKAQAPTAPAAPAPAPAQPAAAAPTGDIVSLKQIVIPAIAGEPAVVTKVKMDRAAALKKEITSCADMDRRMADYAAPGTGDLGTGDSAQLPPALQAAIKDLPVGTLSDPVTTPAGIALVMVCSRDAAPETPAVTAAADTAAAQQQAQAAPETQAAPQSAADAATAAAANGGDAATPAAGDENPDEAMRDDIANQIGNQRLEQMAERYLRDLRATAFIDRRY
jgi:parvulin-like peptidyl-prolyl isomerase